VVSVFDTGLDPVRLVAAAPEVMLINKELPKRHLIIATEYVSLTSAWIAKRGLDAEVLHVSGSTEVFPPDDADMIVDNTATGTTLDANRLTIIDTLTSSSTHLCVHRSVLDNPVQKRAVDNMILLLRSALEARNKVVLEFNVTAAALDSVVKFLPSMKTPTINSLFGPDGGFAVKVVVPRSDVPQLLPKIKASGGSDILVSQLSQVVP
jgi:ATP phosphoribosyltransferase